MMQAAEVLMLVSLVAEKAEVSTGWR